MPHESLFGLESGGASGRQQRQGSTLQSHLYPHETRALRYVQGLADPEDQRQDFVSLLDHHGWNSRVYLVAASGFFTDSYNLFASNVILPSLAYVYFHGQGHGQTTEIAINALTLAGSAVGQFLFGWLADRFGRQRLYGVELVIVIFTTLGLATCGPGFSPDGTSHSMSVKTLLMCWRFAMGIEIGAEYPLSACIAVEWSSRQHRAKMLSAVFLMQPLGQFCAYGVGLAVLYGLQYRYNLRSTSEDLSDQSRIGIDIVWRIVTGVGAIPALIAFSFRFLLPESGRYTFDVETDARRAIKDTRRGTRHLSLANSRSNSGAINVSGRQRRTWRRGRPEDDPQANEYASLS